MMKISRILGASMLVAMLSVSPGVATSQMLSRDPQAVIEAQPRELIAFDDVRNSPLPQRCKPDKHNLLKALSRQLWH